jgi:hypothetical protein
MYTRDAHDGIDTLEIFWDREDGWAVNVDATERMTVEQVIGLIRLGLLAAD